MNYTKQELIDGRIVYPDYPSNTKIMKTHQELECPTLEKIQQEVLEWVDKTTDYLKTPGDKSFWHLINYVDLVKYCPSLLAYMRSIGIPLREISIGVLTESMKDSGFELHMDNPPLNIKINFPIYNTEDVYTEWYDIPELDMIKLGTEINQHVTDFVCYNYTLRKIHDTVQDLYPCITRYNMHKNPIVFNSWIPHRVMAGPDAKYPRIMIACIPIKEPTHLLMK
jgi:hypothetical protein